MWQRTIDLRGLLLKHEKLNQFSKYSNLKKKFMYRKKRALKETSASEVVSTINEFANEIETNSKYLYL